jgi:hypothetical protein
VPQGSVLGPHSFNILINDLCNSNKHCDFLNFADNLKFFRDINSPCDSLLLQSDIDFMSDWCAANSMRLNIAKTRVVSYSRKTNVLSCEYQLCHAAITCTSSIKDLGVCFDSKFYIHSHVDFLLSECIKRFRPYSFYNLQLLFSGVCICAIRCVRSKLEYVSVLRNSLTSTDAKMFERIQQKFTSVSISLPLIYLIVIILP